MPEEVRSRGIAPDAWGAIMAQMLPAVEAERKRVDGIIRLLKHDPDMDPGEMIEAAANLQKHVEWSKQRTDSEHVRRAEAPELP